MKTIKVSTPAGQYAVPLKLVAENRADYYAIELDGYNKDSSEYIEEVDFVLNDDYEGIDWMVNNTDWKDWESVAVKLNSNVNVTDDDFWTSTEHFEIVDN